MREHWITCPYCNGEGEFLDEGIDCPRCDGTGKVLDDSEQQSGPDLFGGDQP